MGYLWPVTAGTPKGSVSPNKGISVLPSLFTASHLRHLAWHGFSDLFPFVENLLFRGEGVSRESTLREHFEAAFRIMRRDHPGEYVHKTCLLRRLLFGRHSPRTTSCYFELPVGSARADMVLVNGEADVYEVKSRLDDPARLDSQLEAYYRCFTRVTVVTEASEATTYQNKLPAHVGVAALTPRFSISVKRQPEPHHEGLEHFSLFRMLRQAERSRLAGELGVSLSEIHPALQYQHLHERFSASLSPKEAHEWIKDSLRDRRRRCMMHLAARSDELPPSLSVAAFSYRLREMDWTALFRVLR